MSEEQSDIDDFNDFLDSYINDPDLDENVRKCYLEMKEVDPNMPLEDKYKLLAEKLKTADGKYVEENDGEIEIPRFSFINDKFEKEMVTFSIKRVVRNFMSEINENYKEGDGSILYDPNSTYYFHSAVEEFEAICNQYYIEELIQLKALRNV
ncbi:hypothetical protein PIROE2DRAFT_8186 [Piromyces sp. E2]|nr:hypothetical protein PIROE2DRAFT_8186 [Piromyces sp. E2]|eukprot:OUM64881.1 hypothetical protein PIROE2DRAFT_8186 [Piromyces sp. E2]